MTNGQELFANFGRRLAADGIVEKVDEGFLIRRLYGMEFEPVVRLLISAASLASLIQAMSDVGQEVFPGTSPSTAALQLTLVHLEEELATKPERATTLAIGAEGLRWHGTQDLRGDAI